MTLTQSPATAANVELSPAWVRLKEAATALQGLQAQDGSVPEPADHAGARSCVEAIVEAIRDLAPLFPYDAEYLEASMRDFERWADAGFGIPDFLESLVAFQPQLHRVVIDDQNARHWSSKTLSLHEKPGWRIALCRFEAG